MQNFPLNDSFWVVPQGFTGTFAQYNLYENRFSEILSLVAYTGIGQSDAAFTTSPELTTNGMLLNGWRFIEGKGILASRCKLFTDIDTAYIPIGRIVRECGLKACLEYYKKLGPKSFEEIKSMLVFDAVIYNEDRTARATCTEFLSHLAGREGQRRGIRYTERGTGNCDYQKWRRNRQ